MLALHLVREEQVWRRDNVARGWRHWEQTRCGKERGAVPFKLRRRDLSLFECLRDLQAPLPGDWSLHHLRLALGLGGLRHGRHLCTRRRIFACVGLSGSRISVSYVSL